MIQIVNIKNPHNNQSSWKPAIAHNYNNPNIILMQNIVNSNRIYYKKCANKILYKSYNHRYSSSTSNKHFHKYSTKIILIYGRWVVKLSAMISMEYELKLYQEDRILNRKLIWIIVIIEKGISVQTVRNIKTKLGEWSNKLMLIWWSGVILCIIILVSVKRKWVI